MSEVNEGLLPKLIAISSQASEINMLEYHQQLERLVR